MTTFRVWSSVCLLVAWGGAQGLAQPGRIRDIAGIKFEYCNPDSLRRTNNPLVICVPGFTQHNRSQEFSLLKDFFTARNFSVLIMNPPQHGEVYTLGKLYSWGENEVQDLVTLSDSLQIWHQHDEVHVLGFSIGAKIVLRFAALPAVRDSIASVVAIAAPYRIGAINMRPSTDLRLITEGVRSNFRAVRRASILRILYMVAVGMPKALLVNKATPAKEIDAIRAPTLLLHAADDWMTKSLHSAKLFGRASQDQPFAFVALNTRTHAEDMLTRAKPVLRRAFLDILDNWLGFVRNSALPRSKVGFDQQVHHRLRQIPAVDSVLYPTERVSLMSSPTLHDFNTGLWLSAADDNHSLLTVNSTFKLNENSFAKHYVTFGSTNLSGSLLQKIRLGLSWQQNAVGKLSAPRGQVSLYYPVGSFIWLRRLSYLQSLDHNLRQRIVSADLAFLVLDFQLNYGKFVDSKNDLQLAFNFPLFGNAAASTFFGLGYSRFLSDVPAPLFKNELKLYLVLGPRVTLARARVRATLQYQQSGLNPAGADRIWSLGVSFNFRER